MRFRGLFLSAVFLLASSSFAMADCGVGGNLGEALQGCAGKTVVVFFETMNAQGAFFSIQGKVFSSSADYLTIDNPNAAPNTNRLVIPFRHIFYVQYQF